MDMDMGSVIRHCSSRYAGLDPVRRQNEGILGAMADRWCMARPELAPSGTSTKGQFGDSSSLEPLGCSG